MDDEILKQTREAIDYLRSISLDDIDFDYMDPIAKMMLVAVLHEEQKLRDDIAAIPQRVIERYCSDFIPYDKVDAVPALSILWPSSKTKGMVELVTVGNGASFVYKKKESKLQLNYLPIFKTIILPYSDLFQVSHRHIIHQENTHPIHMAVTNSVWLGIVSEVEIESLKGMSFFVKGTKGVLPEHVSIVAENRNAGVYELEIATMQEMENIDILEPFDAQQSSGQFFSFVNKNIIKYNII